MYDMIEGMRKEDSQHKAQYAPVKTLSAGSIIIRDEQDQVHSSYENVSAWL